MSKKDKRLAITALRLTHRTRKNPDASMPFTVGYLQHVCKAMGHKVGEHRASAMIRELKRTGHLRQQGSYRSKAHGFRVILYLVPRFTSSVRRERVVKRRSKWIPWWKHPLFGNPDGKPPPEQQPGQHRRWVSPYFRHEEMLRSQP